MNADIGSVENGSPAHNVHCKRKCIDFNPGKGSDFEFDCRERLNVFPFRVVSGYVDNTFGYRYFVQGELKNLTMQQARLSGQYNKKNYEKKGCDIITNILSDVLHRYGS